jgi:hypothetical protein
MNATLSSYAIILLVAFVSPIHAQGNAGVCEPTSHRARVPLQPAQDMKFRFYYRLENHVVYIDPREVERYFDAGPAPNRAMAQRIASYGSLSEHTDVFQLFLDSYSAWHELQYMLARALEAGLVSIRRRGGEPLTEIYVEKYTTRSCATGRRFVETDNDAIYAVIDSEA